MPAVAEEANIQGALTSLMNEHAAASSRRTNRADQLAGDSDRMWTIHMTTPTTLAAMGFRVAMPTGALPDSAGKA